MSQIPLADSKKIEDEIKDQKKKGRKYIIWGKPEEDPIPIKLSGAKEKGFVMADQLLEAMGDDKTPWEAYSQMQKTVKKEIYAEIIKADEDKRLVYGVVLEPNGVDAQNDTVRPEEIEHAAHVYLQESRVIGDSHKGKARANVVESYIAPIDFEMGSQKVAKGSWVMAIKIQDSETWLKVKRGHFTGFSIGGQSRRVPA